MDSVLEVFSAFQYIACIAECFCNDGVQYDVRSCNGVTGTNHTELEFVSGEGER